MSILLSAMALATAQGQPAAHPTPPPAHAHHAQHARPSQPGAKPKGEGCTCCKHMAAGAKMESGAKHGEGHGGEHSGHSDSR